MKEEIIVISNSSFEEDNSVWIFFKRTHAYSTHSTGKDKIYVYSYEYIEKATNERYHILTRNSDIITFSLSYICPIFIKIIVTICFFINSAL